MRNIFILIFALVFTNGAMAQEEFTLNGKLFDAAYEGSTVTIRTVVNGKDSAYLGNNVFSKIVNGKFQLKGASDKFPEIGMLSLTDPNNQRIDMGFIILEQGTADLTIDDTREVIIQTPLNLKDQAFRNQQVQLMSAIQDLNDEVKIAMDAGNFSESDVSNVENRFDSIKNLVFNNAYSYVKNNIKNRVGEFYFISVRDYLQPAQLKELYNLASPDFQQSMTAKMIMNDKVWSTDGFNMGDKLKDIDLPTDAGKIARLSDYTGKGKVVLVDFWASWCGPCLKEMPLIVSLYAQYKDKNFEIVGISLDENKARWQSSISRLNMKWPQLSDLGGWKSKAAQMFNISRIPQNYLLDGEGRIVAHDLHGDALTKKLGELLGK